METFMASMLNLLIILVPLAIMYFFLITPQKKKEKAVAQMRSQLQVGDKIITIGGIIGRVINIKEDAVTIETGSEKNRMRIMRWAIQTRESAEGSNPEISGK